MSPMILAGMKMQGKGEVTRKQMDVAIIKGKACKCSCPGILSPIVLLLEK